MTCPNCAARVPATAALCARCDFNLARFRAEETERAALSRPAEPGIEFRHRPGVSIFLSILAATAIGLAGLMAYSIVFGSFPDSAGNIGFAVVMLAIAALLVWVVVRRAGVAFAVTPGTLVRGKLVVALPNLRFASGTRLGHVGGASTTSISFYFRNRDVKGAIMIPGTIRDQGSLIKQLLDGSGLSKGLDSELEPHCPYCGRRQPAEAFRGDDNCSECGKPLQSAIRKLNENMRRVYTGNRVGLVIVSIMVAAGLAIYFAVASTILENVGLFLYVLLSIFIVLSLLYPWSFAWRMFRHESTMIRQVDVQRREGPESTPTA